MKNLNLTAEEILNIRNNAARAESDMTAVLTPAYDYRTAAEGYDHIRNGKQNVAGVNVDGWEL